MFRNSGEFQDFLRVQDALKSALKDIGPDEIEPALQGVISALQALGYPVREFQLPLGQRLVLYKGKPLLLVKRGSVYIHEGSWMCLKRDTVEA